MRRQLGTYRDQYLNGTFQKLIKIAISHFRPGLNFVEAFEKWAVDRETWSEPLYPKCCYGPAYILTPESVHGIVNAYEKSLVTFSKFEDIYITGTQLFFLLTKVFLKWFLTGNVQVNLDQIFLGD